MKKPVSVLFMTYSFLPKIGGVERSVYNLAKGLNDDYKITLVTHDPKAIIKRKKWENIWVYYLNITSPFNKKWLRIIAGRIIFGFNFLILCFLCISKRIRLIHCHHLNVDTQYAQFLSKILRIKYLLTLRGGETEEWINDRNDRRNYVIRALRESNCVSAVSKHLISHAEKLVPNIKSKSTVICNGIDAKEIENYCIKSSEHIEANKPYILYVGRLEKMKNVGCLISAYKLLKEKKPNINLELILAGDGTEAGILKKKLKSSQKSCVIKFLGNVDYQDSLYLIKNSLSVVLPSQYSEGCPNVVLEAKSLRTPVIVSDIPSLKELVNNEIDGLTFRNGNIRDLEEKIEEILNDEKKRKRIVGKASDQINQNYSYRLMLEKYMGLYGKLLKE